MLQSVRSMFCNYCESMIKQIVECYRETLLHAYLVRVPPDIATPEELKPKTGSVNCTTKGKLVSFVLAREVVLRCTCGLSLSAKDTSHKSASRRVAVWNSSFQGLTMSSTYLTPSFTQRKNHTQRSTSSLQSIARKTIEDSCRETKVYSLF